MDKILFAIYLIWISVQDFKTMQVVRYSHLLGITAIVLAATEHGLNVAATVSVMNVAEIVLVCLLEITGYFLKCYGLADVFSVCICAAFYFFESNRYECVLFTLLLQSVSGILLIVVQMFKGNIKGLHLKQSVPYIPYISVSFFLTKWVL